MKSSILNCVISEILFPRLHNLNHGVNYTSIGNSFIELRKQMKFDLINVQDIKKSTRSHCLSSNFFGPTNKQESNIFLNFMSDRL